MENTTSNISNRTPANIVKIAVKFYIPDPTKLAQMVVFDRTRPLTAFLADRCATWNLENPADYALQFSEGNPTYITEKNRSEIKNGSVLTLCPSVYKNVKSILDSINMGDGTKKQEALKQLSTFSPDISFVQEFINQHGMDLLINIIEGGGWDKSPATAGLSEVVAVTLGCFLELMDHGLVSWDVVDQAFINKISSYVNQSTHEPAVVQYSLTILEYLLLNSSKQALVEKQISWDRLVQHLKRSQTQPNTLSYINAIFTKAPNDAAREKLYLGILSQEIRSTILNSVIPSSSRVSADVARQVYILQCHLMQVVAQRSLSGRLDSEMCEKQIAEIRKTTAAVLAEVPLSPNLARKASDSSDEMNRLGFKSPKMPLDDLTTVTHGPLVLDCMHDFATRNSKVFRQWVLESFSREVSECPFFASSVEVVNIFVDLFRIGQAPADQGGVYDSVIFSSEYPLEEAYCLAMMTLNRTWKEMKATSQDFPKVMGVLKEQITQSLRNSPAPPTFDIWKNRIREFNYAKINEIRDMRRTAKEELESQAEPMVELREMLRPDVIALIGENRLRHMQKGSKFAHRTSGGGFRAFGDKKQAWCCRLSQNKKLLHYGDVDGSDRVPSAEEIPNVVAVSDIKALLTGKDCPHVKNKKSASSLAFSLVLTGDKKTLDFIAPSDKEYQMWTDGIHKLLGEEMISMLASDDLKSLLAWEIKLRLLGMEGIPIPEKTPEFPPPPDNFNFKFHA